MEQQEDWWVTFQQKLWKMESKEREIMSLKHQKEKASKLEFLIYRNHPPKEEDEIT